jgi:DNA repair ATPase RecN
MANITDIKNISFNDNIDKMITDLSQVYPSAKDLQSGNATKNKTKNKKDTKANEDVAERLSASDVQIEILKCLKGMKIQITDLQGSLNAATREISEVKTELGEYKKLVKNYEVEVTYLKSNNNSLQRKVNHLERESRLNKLILSGPLVKINNNSTPEELVDQSVNHIKNVYHFNLEKTRSA